MQFIGSFLQILEFYTIQERIMRIAILLPVVGLCLVPLFADEKLKGIACRSVHLGYPAPEGVAFYTEAKVEKSAEGTYFMTCGWGKGYFGIQELGNGKKLVLFSVWDPTNGDDPKKVPEERKVKLLHKDPEVRVGRFGNEGTGGQSFYDYDWKLGVNYRFMVTAKADGKNRTAYSGYFFNPEKKQWKHLVTFATESPVISSRNRSQIGRDSECLSSRRSSAESGFARSSMS